jgi:hypothetical protein
MTTQEKPSPSIVRSPRDVARVRKEHIVEGLNGKLRVESYDELIHHPYPLHTGTPSYELRGRIGGAQ